METPYDTTAARSRIADIVVRTPLLHSRWLSDHIGQRVMLKLECLQVTGSFKVRGAANRILGLGAAEAAAGVIACSSGNHGLATAHVAARCGIAATICVPEWVDPIKLDAMRELGADVVVEGATADEAEAISFKLQEETGATYIHPFDDPEIISGQGTIGEELVDEMAEVTQVLVPVSGGGLVAGIALAVGRRAPDVAVTGAYAERSPAMARSVDAGRPVELEEEEPTVATALSGGIGPVNRHTLELVRRAVAGMVAVPEEQILQAMRGLHRHHRLIVEGGGAVAVGALLANRVEASGPVAVVVSGGNVDLRRFLEATASSTGPGVRGEQQTRG